MNFLSRRAAYRAHRTRSTHIFACTLPLLCSLLLPCRAGLIVVDHQPHNTGGSVSDTEFFFPQLPGVQWQRVADDFVLSQPSSIVQVNWWGFYQEDNPPASETMRVRFYGSRPGDGLPDDTNIIYEESFNNPSRTWTGRQVFTDVIPREYFFEVDLLTPVPLTANTTYWLEVAQVGDPNTRFRWEFSRVDTNGHAFINLTTDDWRLSYPLFSITSDTAFQLLIPEPSVFGLLSIGAVLTSFHRRRVRSRVGQAPGRDTDRARSGR